MAPDSLSENTAKGSAVMPNPSNCLRVARLATTHPLPMRSPKCKKSEDIWLFGTSFVQESSRQRAKTRRISSCQGARIDEVDQPNNFGCQRREKLTSVVGRRSGGAATVGPAGLGHSLKPPCAAASDGESARLRTMRGSPLQNLPSTFRKISATPSPVLS
jgi:hypothetical protein